MAAQCPACGRFLKRELVAGLLVADAPCPRCGATLTRAMFHGDDTLVHAPEPLAESVRPPDLPVDAVRAADPLAGWDATPAPPMAAEPPVDALALAGGALVGALVGGMLLRRRRGLGITLGAVAGVAVAGSARRIWELPG